MAKYYKNTEGRLFVDPRPGRASELTEITEEEFNILVNPEPTIEDQMAEIAAQRYAMETEDFEYGGVIYSMSREDRNVMFQTVSYILAGVVSSVRWKAKSGWITLDATNAPAIQAAIINKVQSAFIWEESQLNEL